MALLHQKLAVAVVLAALLGTVWSLYRAYNGGITPRLIATSWVMVVLLVVEGASGTVLGTAGSRPDNGSHFVFGPLTLLPLPLALLGSRRLQRRYRALVVGAGWLLTTGLALRATGSGGLTA